MSLIALAEDVFALNDAAAPSEVPLLQKNSRAPLAAASASAAAASGTYASRKPSTLQSAAAASHVTIARRHQTAAVQPGHVFVLRAAASR
jgi:hypothetical protein